MSISIEDLPSLHDVKVARARKKLINFTKYTKDDYSVNWHHRYLAEKLDQLIEGKITRLMVFMPPRYGKSELVSRRLPAFALGRNPKEQIVATSYGANLASAMNRDVQRIIDSEKYAEVFPNTRIVPEGERIGKWIRNNEMFEVIGSTGTYKSAGIGGSITGSGFTLGIIDDPIKNHEEAFSQTYRDALWEWYTSTFYTRMEKGARILLTMTRWHHDDLAGRLLRLAQEDPEADQWEVVEFPAILEVESPYDPRKVGDPLWPEKFNLDSLMKVKRLSSYHWNALYQQRPQPIQGGILKRNWWKFYKVMPKKYNEIIMSWDMTFKDTKASDFVVGQVWGRIGVDKYLLDQVRDRMDFVTALQAVKALCSKWPQARLKLVEDKANGPAIINVLKSEIPGLVPINPEGSKEARAFAVSPDIESGNVYLPDPSIAPWVNDFIEECTQFPNGAHDDQVDAMTQALHRLIKNEETGFLIGKV